MNAQTGITIYCIACIVCCYSLFVALIQLIAKYYRLYESNQYERDANQASKGASHQFVIFVLTKESLYGRNQIKQTI